MDSILLPPAELDALTSAGRQVLHDDLRRGWHVKHVIAIHRQQRIAKAFQDLGPLHHEALGQLTLVVDPVLWEEMRREHGKDCWRDKRFRDDFAKDNPECAVKSKSRKTALRVDGWRRHLGGQRSEVRGQRGTGTEVGGRSADARTDVRRLPCAA